MTTFVYSILNHWLSNWFRKISFGICSSCLWFIRFLNGNQQLSEEDANADTERHGLLLRRKDRLRWRHSWDRINVWCAKPHLQIIVSTDDCCYWWTPVSLSLPTAGVLGFFVSTHWLFRSGTCLPCLSSAFSSSVSTHLLCSPRDSSFSILMIRSCLSEKHFGILLFSSSIVTPWQWMPPFIDQSREIFPFCQS